jgi:Membrane-associated lipoprotein involved in thiamine biosynthesis
MIRNAALMGTIVTIHVVGHKADHQQTIETEDGVERAFEWFRRVEECCTRFDAHSEAMQLTAQIGVPVPVSALLFEAVRFAVAVAEESGGAFDPTVGHHMETRGFNREYRTGQIVQTALEPGGAVSYRDVRVDPDRKTITLLRPLILDLGAVAKGLAIDMAAHELRRFEDYAIDAGGDLYLAGRNQDGAPWSVGIRHPRVGNQLIGSLRVSNTAVCTSGDYERRSSSEDGGHHILDPRTGASANAVASVTVVAPTAMVADALATAAFVLGPADGIRLLERQGVDGLIVAPTLERYSTPGMLSACSPGQGTAARAGCG